MVIVVQYNILKIFLLCTSVKLIKLILYFIIVLLMNKRDLHFLNFWKYNIVSWLSLSFLG